MSLQEEVIRAQVDQFERDGYLVVPDVLSSEKVDRLNTAIDEVQRKKSPAWRTTFTTASTAIPSSLR